MWDSIRIFHPMKTVMMDCNAKLPPRKPKVGHHDTQSLSLATNENSRSLQES
jgi:hypothetical protein